MSVFHRRAWVHRSAPKQSPAVPSYGHPQRVSASSEHPPLVEVLSHHVRPFKVVVRGIGGCFIQSGEAVHPGGFSKGNATRVGQVRMTTAEPHAGFGRTPSPCMATRLHRRQTVLRFPACLSARLGLPESAWRPPSRPRWIRNWMAQVSSLAIHQGAMQDRQCPTR